MRSGFLFLLLLCCTCTFSQATNETDSLKAVIKSNQSYANRIRAYLVYGDKYGMQNFEETFRIATEGIDLAAKNKDSAAIGQLKRHIGESFYFRGKYDTAAQYFYQSITVLERQQDKKKLAGSYNALAKLYRKTRDLKRALTNYDKALGLFKALNDSAGIAMIMNESGVVFEYAGDYDKAIERYAESYRLDKLLNDSIGMAYALNNLAGAYTLQKKFNLAEDHLLQALAIRKIIKDTFALAINYSDLGASLISNKQYARARNYVDTSVAIALKMNFPELLQYNYQLLAQIAEETGNYKEALTYYQKRTALRDSIFNIEKTKQIEELNTKYETVKKEQTISEQQGRLTRQRMVLIGSSVLFILIGLLAYTQYRRYKWKQEARMREEVLKQQELAMKAVIEAEEAERQRIAKDLHDGVGQMMSAAKMNLSAFEHAASFRSADERFTFEKIIDLVDESCKEVRAVSHNMMPNALLKNNLAAAIREFINKLDSKALKVHLYTEGLDERLDSNIETVLYRVIQECVNNVIKHSGANMVDISMIKEQGEITATIEDNGKGFDTSDASKFDGIGLKNIKTRVEYLKGTVEFDSTPGKGTLVAVHVPL